MELIRSEEGQSVAKGLNQRADYLAKQTPQELRCPACSKPYLLGEAECKACGVIIQKALRRKQLSTFGLRSVEATPAVQRAWDALAKDYENRELHREFFLLCLAQDSLAFAAYRYSRILSVFSGEEFAVAQLALIRKWNEIGLGQEKKAYGNYRNLNILELVLGWAGFSLIILGIYIPALLATAGIGVTLVALAFIVRYLLVGIIEESI